ncbi:MAG: coenzyme A pyrophosphatase [Alphaproteobacteria bacterium]|nr:MAG: coenzyme A pyrophosphatase [Alphaproteobacteria bacterium]
MRTIDSSEAARMTPDELRRLARERLGEEGGGGHGDFLFNPDVRDQIVANALLPAAVLIPILDRPGGLNVLLTKRRESLRAHSGQVAFPGGRIDPDDESVEAAALREAREEIGLEPRLAEIIGRLPDYHTGSGYRIAPVVALVDGRAPVEPNPAEVDYIFEVPFAFLMDRANHRTGSREFNGRLRHYLEMPYGEHYIWGVTAGIIRVLRDRIFP